MEERKIINIQKSVAFLHPNSEQLENVIQEKIFETSKENNKSQLRHIKDDLNRYRDVSCSWVGKCVIIKISIFPRSVYLMHIQSVFQ